MIRLRMANSDKLIGKWKYVLYIVRDVAIDMTSRNVMGVDSGSWI
jgi:hypothetical protein